MKVKGYKGFDKDLKCRDMQYEVGKTYTTKESIKLCNSGFHFCRDFKNVDIFYSFANNNYRFCEVEALGDVEDKNDKSKSVTNKIKIIREISKEEMFKTLNIGDNNIGFFNTGDWNTGDSNTGYRNAGNRNAGNSNTGDWNTGDSNTGYSNTGYSNTGDWNTGDSNTGYSNTGDRNAGNSNTGYRNAGDWNTGDWNKTNRSAGVFCNEEPKIILFNKKSNMTYEDWTNTNACYILRQVEKNVWISFDDMSNVEKTKYPSAETCGGYLKEIPLKEASKKWWNNLSDDDKKEIFSLPNFNLTVFNDIMELQITQAEYERLK